MWTVVIPAKALPEAKSRLAAATPDAATHRRLVEAIRTDTVAAAQAAPGVARVLVVVDRAGDRPAAGADTLTQRSPGLNAAVREAAAHAAGRWPDDGVAALVGDLPALRAADLGAVLAAAATHRRSFVADAAGTGTTLLAASPGHEVAPQFGTGSAARHAASAVALPAGAGLRTDVDTADDLADAAVLGLGPATTAELARGRVEPRVPADRGVACGGIVGP